MSSEVRIRILPEHVINKIAAGEVVERPASALKELLENALDSGATQIDVEVAAGGRTLVAVRDNGCGLSRDDALLSVERHATSKIRDVDDIEHIATLGFRGEALAAIASVSRFRMVTCRRGEVVGTELLIVGGKIQDARDIGCPAGCSVEVRDLFFNVPARRKFLRSQPTELSHVRAGFMLQALSHPAVGMSLKVDGAETLRLPASDRVEDRVRELFGQDYTRNLKIVEHDLAGIRVTGFVGLPTVNRSDREEQFVFVNGRAAGAPLIAYAIREGYHTLMPSDRHASVFLFLSLDPGMVDVNVHPTKREVRFRDPGAVRDAVVEAIRHALGTTAYVPPSAKPGSAPVDTTTRRPAGEQMKIGNLPITRAFKYPGLPAQPGFGAHGTLASGAEPTAPPNAASPASAAQPAPRSPAAPWSWCRVVGQVGNLYVVLETEDGFVLMDPHAAHERVLFERFMTAVAQGKISSQNLLLPETVNLGPKDALRVRRNVDVFKELGFGISEFGGDVFVVDALPACFAGASPQGLLIEIAHELEVAGARGGKGRWREEAIAQAACKAAMKARDNLRLEEIEQLVIDLARTEMPYTCPHGRPTLIFTSFQELNRKFGRE